MKVKNKKFREVPEIRTIKELVINGVTQGQDQKLFIYEHKGEVKTSTFNDVWHDINCLGSYEFKHGLRDCHIAILGENSYEWIVSFFANLLGRNVSVPLDPKLPAEDLLVQLKESGCKAIVYSKKYAEYADYFKANGAPMEQYLYIEDFPSYIDEGEKLMKDGYKDYTDLEISPEDLAAIVYTSGTTGKSKGVMLTHGNLASVVVASCERFQGGNSVGFLPLNHCVHYHYIRLYVYRP